MQHQQQTETCARLMRALSLEYQREQCIETICGETPSDIAANVNALLTRAPKELIISTINKIESIKGKAYAQVRIENATPYAGIPETLYEEQATIEELTCWLDQIKKTSFANGTKYQPLPSHDEAWQIFFPVRTKLTNRRFAAEQFEYLPNKVTVMSDADIILAARWGFWGDCPVTVKRRLFTLLPPAVRLTIKSQKMSTTQAMQAVEDFYNNPATIT